MAIVDVGLAITDLHLLSDRVEVTDKVASNGQPVFGKGAAGALFSLDFAAVRVGPDTWHVVKNRKQLAGNPGLAILHGSHAYIRAPIDEPF